MSGLTGHVRVSVPVIDDKVDVALVRDEQLEQSFPLQHLQPLKKDDHLIKDLEEEEVPESETEDEKIPEEDCCFPDEIELSKEDRLVLANFSLTTGLSERRLHNDVLTSLKEEGMKVRDGQIKQSFPPQNPNLLKKDHHFIIDVVEEEVSESEIEDEEILEEDCCFPDGTKFSKEELLLITNFSLTTGIPEQQLLKDVLNCLKMEGS